MTVTVFCHCTTQKMAGQDMDGNNRTIKYQNQLALNVPKTLALWIFMNCITVALAMRRQECTNTVPCSSGDESRLTDEQKLLTHLRRDYDHHTRPVFNASHPVIVKLGITLNQIFDVDERNQVLTTHIWLDQEWNDEKMTWDPEEYNGLKTIRIPCHLIWKPDIVLYNSADDYTESYMEALAMVKSDGTVFWPPIVKLRSTCKIDITYFPFDDQTCTLKLGSWAYDGFQVDVLKRDQPIDLSNFVSNGEWEMINVTTIRNVRYYSCCPEPYPDVTFHLHMRRRTLYYTYNVIIPCIMLSCLTLLEFWIPPEGGEKVALGLTVLLAYSVFMLLIAENMPASSYYVPLIGAYIICVMWLSSLSVMCSVIVCNLHHQSYSEREVPKWLRTLAKILNRWVMVSPRRLSSKTPSTSETSPDLKTPLRSSYSSINLTFRGETGEVLSNLSYMNEHARHNSPPLSPSQKSRQNGHAPQPPPKPRIKTDLKEPKEPKPPKPPPRSMSTDPQPQSKDGPATPPKIKRRHANTSTNQCSTNSEEILKKLEAILARQEELLKPRTDSVNREWQEVAEIVDRFLFWLYFAVTLIVTIVILVLVPLGKSNDI